MCPRILYCLGFLTAAALAMASPVSAQNLALRAALKPVDGQNNMVQYTLTPELDQSALQPGDALQVVNDLAAHGYTYAVHHADGDWVCSVDLNTLTCAATVDADGVVALPPIRVAARTDAGGRNCATLKLTREGSDPELRRSCINPDGSVRDAALVLEVPEKTDCIAPQASSFGCSLNVQIRNSDDRPFSGAIAVNGRYDGSLQSIDARSNHGASCTALSSSTSSCYIPSQKIDPGTGIDLTMGITLPPQPADQIEACFNFGASGDPVLQVVQVQSALAAQGIDPGGVDGKAGPKTRDAVARLQAREGLEENGEIDENILFLLGLTAQAQADPSCVVLALQKPVLVATTEDQNDAEQVDQAPLPETQDTQEKPETEPKAVTNATGAAKETLENTTDASPQVEAAPQSGDVATAETETTPDTNPEAPATAQAEDRPKARPSDLKPPQTAATTVSSGISCGVGTTLRAGRCVADQAVGICDPESAVASEFGCSCRYRNMTQISMTKCICRNRVPVVSGAGCIDLSRVGG